MSSDVDTTQADHAELLQLELEKTHLACYDAHKAIAKAFNLYVVFAVTLATVMVSSDSTGKVNVPLVGLVLGKWDATAILATLVSGAFYRFWVAFSYGKLLALKLQEVLKEVGFMRYPWNFFYPSFYTYHTMVRSMSWATAFLEPVRNFLVSIFGLLYAPSCLMIVTWNTHSTVLSTVAWVLSSLFLIGSGLIMFATPQTDKFKAFRVEMERYDDRQDA